jgi:hypothetical protein
MKPIRLSAHARSYLTTRGFTVEEVERAIRESPWEPAERGKTQCRQDFSYRAIWNGKPCEWKQVRPVFVEEPDEIIVVTVYTYYF